MLFAYLNFETLISSSTNTFSYEEDMQTIRLLKTSMSMQLR